MIRTLSKLLLATLFVAGVAHAKVATGIPEITPDSVFHGGQTLSLHGLTASPETATHLTFMNLAKTGNRCSLALTTVDGVRMGPVTTLTLKPLESRPFLNVFEHMIKVYGSTEAQATVSCSQDFYAYGLLADGSTGRLDLVAPVEAEDSVELPAAVPECPATAICSDAPGVVYVPGPPPGPPLPVGRVTFPAPKGIAKRFLLSMNVTVGPWYAPEPSGKHLIYWFVINNNKDMPGLLYFLGPNKNEAFARHGLQLTHPQKLKVIRPFAAKVGHTYHVVNDYDLIRKSFSITITDMDTGEVAVALPGKPNLQTYTIKAGSKYLVDMGFYPGKVPTEVPSYGWTYADVHIETYLK
ncbi:MAG TPA: hypothetical protein VF173_31670 [Thermoanaerobaculia bacterium]|nr:hypothetical protein [Thermoanaerobaculia bacterium]